MGAARALAFAVGAAALAACAGAVPPRAAPPALEIPSAEPSDSTPTPEPRDPLPPASSSSEVTYSGELWSDSELCPVETTLSASAAGLTGGRYTMLIDDRRIPGTLSQCFPTDGSHFTCLWQDEFGTGGLDLELSADREQFDGQWWGEASPSEKHPWDGRRIAPDATP